MKFTYFKFENFKGIENQTLKLTNGANIFTLVGLNESGKTTILEAINFFKYKQESLDVLGLESYTIEDIHDLIPINKRDNFNSTITIEAGLELSSDEIDTIKKNIYREKEIVVSNCSSIVTYTQTYHFENSIHIPEKDKSLWTFGITGKKKRAKIIRQLANDDKLIANKYLIKNIPSILYFPNFLFEFPEKIYLDSKIDDAKHHFYQQIIQDVLDSLKNDTNINEHLISRVLSDDKNEKRNLNSLKGKMERQLSKIIFHSWNEIFNKKISQKVITLQLEYL